ncbi:Ribosomal RNA-processing protein 7 A [Chytridiales sp. JEL 0842]|nr:Ribosomal RNA-processing protein 7 A [Chytridiales sp. JEL 0842]
MVVKLQTQLQKKKKNKNADAAGLLTKVGKEDVGVIVGEDEDENMLESVDRDESEDTEDQDDDEDDEDDDEEDVDEMEEDDQDNNEEEDEESSSSSEEEDEQEPTMQSQATILPPLPTFQSFKVLPLTMPPLSTLSLPSTKKQSLPSIHTHYPLTPRTLSHITPVPVTHYILMRPHSSRKKDERFPEDRTLFLVGVPVDATKSHFERLFRRCGIIEAVYFSHDQQESSHNKPDDDGEEEDEDEDDLTALLGKAHPSGTSAHVVFRDEESLERVQAMRLRKRLWAPSTTSLEGDESQSRTPLFGLQKYLSMYTATHPPLPTLKSLSTSSLKHYEHLERLRIQQIEQERNKPDADGFILVTRGGDTTARKRGSRKDEESGVKVKVAANDSGEVKKKKKKAEKVDFYRFQLREAKREQLAELRRKFEEDKKRVEEMKGRRRFKPY